MSKLGQLLHNYQRFVSLPWESNLSGSQKIWFVIYDKAEERTLRQRISEFELATKNAQHGWLLHDVTNEFPRWMADQEYRDGYFQSPEDLDLLMPQFKEYLCANVMARLADCRADERTVLALVGLGSLFGLLKVSELVPELVAHIRGRLVIFFPGDYDNNNYRFLEARDGWNYLAVPITAHQGTIER
ncbi:MAG: DUF1788 domain-containing protein [Synechococcales cyanobacterium]